MANGHTPDPARTAVCKAAREASYAVAVATRARAYDTAFADAKKFYAEETAAVAAIPADAAALEMIRASVQAKCEADLAYAAAARAYAESIEAADSAYDACVNGEPAA